VTAAVITMGGPSAHCGAMPALYVCGECIANSAGGETLQPKDAASALESLCVRVKGIGERQLARQLTATALNCIVSGRGNNCSGASIEHVFTACQSACTHDAGATMNIEQCIEALDCYNNGMGLPDASGVCGASTGSHARALPLGGLFPNGSRCAGKVGPAGSADECQKANESTCTIIGSSQSACVADTCPNE